MHKAQDQLQDEVIYRHLAEFLRSGGGLEIGGELIPHGAFARIRKGNKTVLVPANYRDFAAVLKAMDSMAQEFMGQGSEQTWN